MKPDKGNNTLNIIFGLFLVVNIVREGMIIRERYRQKNTKQCDCGE